MFYCAGCDYNHIIYTDEADLPDYHAKWSFDGNMRAPTFKPSLLCRTGHHVRGMPQPPDCDYCGDDSDACTICHSFIRNGKIEYLSDCTHDLAGKTVDMVDVISDD